MAKIQYSYLLNNRQYNGQNTIQLSPKQQIIYMAKIQYSYLLGNRLYNGQNTI